MGMIDDLLDESYGEWRENVNTERTRDFKAKDLPLGRKVMMMNKGFTTTPAGSMVAGVGYMQQQQGSHQLSTTKNLALKYDIVLV